MNAPVNNHIPIFDLYSIWYTPFWRTRWFFWCVLLCGIMITILSLYSIYRWYQRRTVKSLTKAQHAIKQLSLLIPEEYVTKKQFDQFYTTITAILKRYLSHIWQINLESYTDEELIRTVKLQQIPPATSTQLEQIISGALHVKYAQQHSPTEQMHSDIDKIIDLISTIDKIYAENQQKT